MQSLGQDGMPVSCQPIQQGQRQCRNRSLSHYSSKIPTFSPVPRPSLLNLPRLIAPGTAPLATAADAAPAIIATTNAAPKSASIVVAQCSQGCASEDTSRCGHLPGDYVRSAPESGRHGHAAVLLRPLSALLSARSRCSRATHKVEDRVSKDAEAVHSRGGSRSCGSQTSRNGTRVATAITPRRDGAYRSNAGRGAGFIPGPVAARMCVRSCSRSGENANGMVELTPVDC